MLDGFPTGSGRGPAPPINPTLVSPIIARLLGVEDPVSHPPPTRFSVYLRGKQLPLAVDTFERWDAAPGAPGGRLPAA